MGDLEAERGGFVRGVFRKLDPDSDLRQKP
jgi:hypothetical protein